MYDADMTSSRRNAAKKNHILFSLPPEDLERLIPHLEKVDLPSGRVLYAPDVKIEYIYFPDCAMVSVVANTASGQSAEAGVIGFEGLVGLDALFGARSTPNEHIVQMADMGLRAKLSVVQAEFDRGGAFQKLTLAFARVMMLQISQTALCNRLHTVEHRLSRWLLICRDRSKTNQINLTQEFLGIMLGTSRVSVTQASTVLQKKGLTEYSRGKITIVNRKKLEEYTCDCYKTVKNEYGKYLKHTSI